MVPSRSRLTPNFDALSLRGQLHNSVEQSVDGGVSHKSLAEQNTLEPGYDGLERAFKTQHDELNYRCTAALTKLPGIGTDSLCI